MAFGLLVGSADVTALQSEASMSHAPANLKESLSRMTTNAHRLTHSVMAVVFCGQRPRLESLPAGSILVLNTSEDEAGMIEATCEGKLVIVFRRDLDQWSEVAQTLVCA